MTFEPLLGGPSWVPRGGRASPASLIAFPDPSMGDGKIMDCSSLAITLCCQRQGAGSLIESRCVDTLAVVLFLFFVTPRYFPRALVDRYFLERLDSTCVITEAPDIGNQSSIGAGNVYIDDGICLHPLFHKSSSTLHRLTENLKDISFQSFIL